MAKVIVTGKVKDPVAWEKGFLTHGDLFKSQTARSVSYSIGEGNKFVVCFDPVDLAASLKVLESPATAEAMEVDGVLRDTVEMFVLDKEVNL